MRRNTGAEITRVEDRKSKVEFIYYSSMDSLIGKICLAASQKGIKKIELAISEKDFLNFFSSHIKIVRADKVFDSVKSMLFDYFNGKRFSFDEVAIDIGPVSDFQKAVWMVLRKIPYGNTVSYQWVAEQIGRPLAGRAVGMACGKNPIPIIIPCHRVIGSNGDLRGFSAGANIKRRLLEIEGVNFQR